MQQDRRITLCLTNYNRTTMLFESFHGVLNDDRVSEIVIVDDHSKPAIFEAVQNFCSAYPKIKLYRNHENLGCYRNKAEAISKASNEFVVIFDSDNVFTTDYVNSIFAEHAWHRNRILAPEFARPHFDYRAFSLMTISRSNVREFMAIKRFDCIINTMNYFVHRDEYLRVWDSSIEPWTADTAYQNYNWLAAGNTIHVLKGLQYDHLVHNGSHYQEHNRKTGNFFNEVMAKMRALK
jgi:glycosyltransferase involved in cell wall biosynthesis